jgi:hypothetical protein
MEPDARENETPIIRQQTGFQKQDSADLANFGRRQSPLKMGPGRLRLVSQEENGLKQFKGPVISSLTNTPFVSEASLRQEDNSYRQPSSHVT